MIRVEPIFIAKPDPWKVQFDDPLDLSALAAAKTVDIDLGVSFHNCPLLIKVPSSWDRDRVNMLVAKLRARM